MVTALITSVAVVYRVWSEHSGPHSLEVLAKLELEFKNRLPIKVDDVTDLVDVKYAPTNTIYWYTLAVKDGYEIDANLIEKNIRESTCGNPETLRTIKEKRYSFEYRYRDKVKNTPIASFAIDKCP